MYTFLGRVNAVFFYGATALFIMSCLAAVTTIWMTPKVLVNKLRINELQSLRSMRDPYNRNQITDRAILTFDLDADLSGVFNWNVKQLFVYVTAEYATPSNPRNEVVIWDHVANSTDSAILRLRNAKNKYLLMDQSTDLRGTPVSLTLHWDVMPITGLMYQETKGRHTVKLPTSYCSGNPGTSSACTVEPVE